MHRVFGTCDLHGPDGAIDKTSVSVVRAHERPADLCTASLQIREEVAACLTVLGYLRLSAVPVLSRVEDSHELD